MKIVVCVDDCEEGFKLAQFVSRLDFPKAEYHFFHVLLPILAAPIDGAAAGVSYAKSEMDSLDEAKAQLAELSKEFSRGRDKRSVHRVVRGAPATEILRYADTTKADLLVVGRTRQSLLGRLFLGSVSRSVVVGAQQSVLVVQTPITESKLPMDAVLATDHSAYANRCIEALKEAGPRGIRNLTVLNICNESELARLAKTFPADEDLLRQALLAKFENSTEQIADDLRSIVPEVEAKFVVGRILESIRSVVEEKKAELLVLGAHGHTWLDRVLLGSVSFHEAFGEQYSVLIVRT